MTADPLRIGILNLMHDKVDTQLRFTKVLSEGPYNVDVQYFYPQTHYTSRPVPDLVQEISQPLDFKTSCHNGCFYYHRRPNRTTYI